MEYLSHILILVAVYSLLTISLDLVVGHVGLLSMGHAAFFGLGAYSSALLALYIESEAQYLTNVQFPLGLVAGMLVASIVSLGVSLPSLRLHEDYLVVATFGFQMIVFSVFNNWMEVTRGPLGIAGIPQPVIFGWTVESQFEFLGLAVGLAAAGYLVVWLITTSPFGRVLHAIREDEVFAKSLGKNTLRFKVTVFAASAAMAATAGGFYAHYITYIDPTSFGVMESILVISMVIIGGPSSIWGPVIGAFVLVTLPEALRFAGLPNSVAANFRQIFYGALLVIMMMFRPRGLVGRYAFGADAVELSERRCKT